MEIFLAGGRREIKHFERRLKNVKHFLIKVLKDLPPLPYPAVRPNKFRCTTQIFHVVPRHLKLVRETA